MKIVSKKSKFDAFNNDDDDGPGTIEDWNDPKWHNHAIFSFEVPFEVNEFEYKWKVRVWSRFLSLVLLEKMGQVYYEVGVFHFNGQIDRTRKKMFSFIKANKLLMSDVWDRYKLEYAKEYAKHSK